GSGARPPLDFTSLGELSPRLQEIMSRALAKKLEQRYASASQLGDDLAEVLEAHQRATPLLTTPPDVLQEVATARRQVKEGRIDEGLTRLRALRESHPDSVEARRALRTAQREKAKEARPPAVASDFPELESTFQLPPTSRAPETMLQPTVALPPPGAGAPARSRLPLYLALAALPLLAAAGYLLTRKPPPVVPSEVRIPVRSQPMG